MKNCDGLHGGLNKIAEVLNVERIGPQHQAGSDSLLTLFTFFEMVKVHFNSNLESIKKNRNILYGLSKEEDASDITNLLLI